MAEGKAEDDSAKSKLSGHIYSKSGALLNGARIMCDGFETLTLADGFYVFDDLPTRTFEVRVNLKGFQSESRKVTIRDNEVAVLDFYLSKASGTARISGRVYDSETSKPMVNRGTVILILPISNRYAHIDGDGYYEFVNLPAGTYTMSTSIPEYDDCDTVLAIADVESKVHDFFCKFNRDVEPAWG